MIIEKIELHYYRNYGQLIIEPHEGINILFGQNGSGKTNLLEAIHYCSLGKSHRINQDINAVMLDQPGASCHLWIRTHLSRNEIEVRLRPGEENVKSVWIDQKKVSRLSEMMGVLRCVIFSPEDLNLIKEGPSSRRKFMDMMISQISRPYFISLQQYRVALNQRNAILKKARMENIRPDPMIADFEQAMARHAKMIMTERNRYSIMLAETGKNIYRCISGKKEEDYQVVYHPSVKSENQEEDLMISMLEKSRQEDARTGTTSLGPQRDDLLLSLNGKNMKLYASQGQMRTGALSLKLAQLEIFKRMTNESPVLLLDDVMSELDLERRMNLLNMMEGVQTFITCSDEGDLAEYQNHRTYEVSSSEGQARLCQKKEGPVKESLSLQEPVFE